MKSALNILPALIAFVSFSGCTVWSEREDTTLQQLSAETADPEQPFGGELTTTLTGRLANADIDELSGLTASARHPGAFYAINDSGNAADIFAIGLDGQTLGRWRLPADNRDWEAIAGFHFRDRHWILVADVGDNLRRRRSTALYLVEEPQSLDQAALAPVHSHRLTFEGGAQNVESVAVSVRDRQVYFVAKVARRPVLYSLAIEQAFEPQGIARRRGHLASLRHTPADNFFEMLLASHILLKPTAMDISANDQLAVIGNYRHLYLYRRGNAASWAEVLTRQLPKVIGSHRLQQSESVAFDLDGGSIVFSSEGRRAPLMMLTASHPRANTDLKTSRLFIPDSGNL